MKRLIALAVAASAAAAGAAYTAPPVGAEVLVTSDSQALPTGCSPRQVAAIVDHFLVAFNRGDRKRLDRVFVQRDPTGHSPGRPDQPVGTEFRWYSILDRTIVYRRLLLGYFVERHRQNERMQLLSIALAGRNPVRRQSMDFSFVIRRTADDLPAGLGGNQRIAHGKGAIDCRAQRIYLWSMGMDPAAGQDYPSPLHWQCRGPEGWTPGQPVLACLQGNGSAPNAQEISADFVLSPPTVELPPRCRPGAVSSRIVGLFRAFNLGGSRQFASGFTVDGGIYPYTASASLRAGFRGREAISSFAAARHRAGDGWTMTALVGPRGRVGLPRKAVYVVRLQVSSGGNAVATGGGKIVIACTSGRVLQWVGPALAAPS